MGYCRASLALAFVACTAAAGLPEARAQAGPDDETRTPKPSAGSRADSATVLRSARTAQATFERVRRRNLPRGFGSRSSTCGERVGRFCYWDEEGTSEDDLPSPPPEESGRVTGARNLLIAYLDSASQALAGDDWIAGQHVRYLLEAGRFDDARMRADDCHATAWWCSALLGLVHHARWRHDAADIAFSAALAAMPKAERCEWTDLTVLLDNPLRARYANMPCAERESLNEPLWWLADPLHHRAGNDRRTEHYARVTIERMQHRAASGYGLSWGDDLGELLLRYGWPSHFVQGAPSPGSMEPPSITAHDPSPGYHFLPDGDSRDSLLALTRDRWTIRPERPRERYAPAYATFATLRQLTTLFRRGDSVLVVAAYDVGGDTLMAGASLTGALLVSDGPDAGVTSGSVRQDTPTSGTLFVTAPDRPLLASVEILAGNRVHRSRLGLGFTDSLHRRVRMSELGLFVPGDGLPTSLDGFLQRAMAAPVVRRGEKLGLYWEVYGLRPDDSELILRVEIERTRRGWLGRLGERVGLLGGDGGVRLGWRESARTADSISPRAVVVDLSGLDPGEYRLRIDVGRGSDLAVSTSRLLEVVR